MKKRELDNKNVKLAFHIHKQSASIDVRKQLNDFEQHQKLLKLHGKYKNHKVWGGCVGSASYRGSPPKYKIKDNLLKLPPLSGAKTVFGSETTGKFSISETLMPKLGAMKQSCYSTKNSKSGFALPNDSKPNTASGHQSMKRLESVEEIPRKKGKRQSAVGRNMGSMGAMTQ